MKSAAVKFPSFEQFRADIAKLVGAAQTFQQQSSALLEATAKPATGSPCRENHPRRRDLRHARRVAGRLSHREGVAMKLDLIPFGPIMPPPDIMLALRHPQYFLVAGGILLALIAAWLLFVPRHRKGCVARLGGLTWKRNQFCRGWLITGDTGSGKTSSGINQLAHQVFQNEPTWGGLCIDEKGVYWETLSAMARHYGRERDLIHLQIRADDTDTQWTPPNRYNLTGDRSIPFSTYAKFIVDTATSLGQGGDKGFFKSQAQTHIAHALEMLFELNRPVTLLDAYELLSNRDSARRRNGESRTSPRNAAPGRRLRPLCRPFSHPTGRAIWRRARNHRQLPAILPDARKSPRCFAPAKARSTLPRLTRAKSSSRRCRRSFRPSGVM
ncbi:MAG: hypothetical protein V9H26_12730 [Verrucomicrobiota bacterium]